MENLGYSSAGQLSPLLNDPFYQTIGIGTRVWLAGAQGHVHAEGTQHASSCLRTEAGVPMEGSRNLGPYGGHEEHEARLCPGRKPARLRRFPEPGHRHTHTHPEPEILKHTTVRDRDILAPVIDYSHDYQYKTGKVLARLNYEQLKSGEVTIEGKKVQTGSLSSYAKAREIAWLLKEEITRGEFLLSRPIAPLPANQSCGGLTRREKSR
jgi:L-aspartate semialdehyde sulfurtransferase